MALLIVIYYKTITRKLMAKIAPCKNNMIYITLWYMFMYLPLFYTSKFKSNSESHWTNLMVIVISVIVVREQYSIRALLLIIHVNYMSHILLTWLCLWDEIVFMAFREEVILQVCPFLRYIAWWNMTCSFFFFFYYIKITD